MWLVSLLACLPDTDGDGLPDRSEVQYHATDPYNPDTDGDGLLDGAEVFVHETDPLLDDTDGDSFLDGEEVDEGSDPLRRFHWPFDAPRWPDFSDEVPRRVSAASTFRIGDPLPSFFLRDQHGGWVSPHQFWGMGVLIGAHDMGFPRSRIVASGDQARWARHVELGFMQIHLVPVGAPTPEDLTEWSENAGITFPVSATTSNVPLPVEGIPYRILVNRRMEVVQTWTGQSQEMEREIEAAIESLLDDDAP